MFNIVVPSHDEQRSEDEPGDEYRASIVTMKEQVRALPNVKWIFQAQGVNEKAFLRVVRQMQVAMRGEA